MRIQALIISALLAQAAYAHDHEHSSDPQALAELEAVESIHTTSPVSKNMNFEARVSNTYVTELPQYTEVQTKAMQIPPGYEMVKVSHPPKFACTEYPQPDTFEIRPIAVVQPVPTVGQGNVDAITIITEGAQ